MAVSEKYLPADEYVMVNDRSKRLYPIQIDLPKCPPIETIDGYGLKSENQVFQYEKYPAKLKKLENDCGGVNSNPNKLLSIVIPRNFRNNLNSISIGSITCC